MNNNNNLLGKIVSTAKKLWSKLDDSMPPPNTKTTRTQDISEGALKDKTNVIPQNRESLVANNEASSYQAVKTITYYPTRINEHHLIYAAKIPFRPADNINVRKDILADAEKEVQLTPHEEYVSVSYNGNVFGYIDNPGLSEVIIELTETHLPFTAHLLENCENIYFHAYEDKRIGHENDEQTVCKISAFKAHEKQMVIWLLSPGDQIHMEQYGDRVLLDYNGWPIGKLPPKFAKRYLQEGAYAAFVEKIDIQEIENEEGDIDLHIPYIRIYWNKKDVPNLNTI